MKSLLHMMMNHLGIVLRPHIGWVALLAAIGLTMVGVLAIRTTPYETQAMKQMVWLALGLPVMFMFALPHHRRICAMAYPMMFVTLIMLVLLLLPLPESIAPVKNGSRRWFDLQIMLFQPSEVAKVVFVLSLACYLRYRENYRSFKGLMIPLALSFVPIILILKEPDLGTSMTLLPVFFAMVIAAGAKLKHVAIILLIGLSLIPAMYPVLKPHQKARVKAMLAQVMDDATYRQDIGYQGYKAMTMVGAGQMTGMGGEHTKNVVKYNRLPESHNDMVFAVIAARWGFMGAMGVILLYVILILSGIYASARNKDPFARLVGVGLVTVIFFQMFVNIGMTIGILPITGMTLPFISYGGSSLMVNFAIVGLLFNVAVRKPLMTWKESFEFDGADKAKTRSLRFVAGAEIANRGAYTRA